MVSQWRQRVLISLGCGSTKGRQSRHHDWRALLRLHSWRWVQLRWRDRVAVALRATRPGPVNLSVPRFPQGSGYNYLFEATTTCAAIGMTNSFPLLYRLTPFSIAVRIAFSLSGDWRARSPAVRTPASRSASNRYRGVGTFHSSKRVPKIIDSPSNPS